MQEVISLTKVFHVDAVCGNGCCLLRSAFIVNRLDFSPVFSNTSGAGKDVGQGPEHVQYEGADLYQKHLLRTESLDRKISSVQMNRYNLAVQMPVAHQFCGVVIRFIQNLRNILFAQCHRISRLVFVEIDGILSRSFDGKKGKGRAVRICRYFHKPPEVIPVFEPGSPDKQVAVPAEQCNRSPMQQHKQGHHQHSFSQPLSAELILGRLEIGLAPVASP